MLRKGATEATEKADLEFHIVIRADQSDHKPVMHSVSAKHASIYTSLLCWLLSVQQEEM